MPLDRHRQFGTRQGGPALERHPPRLADEAGHDINTYRILQTFPGVCQPPGQRPGCILPVRRPPRHGDRFIPDLQPVRLHRSPERLGLRPFGFGNILWARRSARSRAARMPGLAPDHSLEIVEHPRPLAAKAPEQPVLLPFPVQPRLDPLQFLIRRLASRQQSGQQSDRLEVELHSHDLRTQRRFVPDRPAGVAHRPP